MITVINTMIAKLSASLAERLRFLSVIVVVLMGEALGMAYPLPESMSAEASGAALTISSVNQNHQIDSFLTSIDFSD
ncbi:hypothetical protein [Xanthomonas indica]|uniref:Uncharacterized protein n=1 Tax=Xanthomonas indica TaxID=2912242 RepID=A0AAU8IBX6_9XANT|nr:hypothetical protein [Xanthomonas indica]MCI2263663.1 hypothetical protein [Xanthomonas indica]